MENPKERKAQGPTENSPVYALADEKTQPNPLLRFFHHAKQVVQSLEENQQPERQSLSSPPESISDTPVISEEGEIFSTDFRNAKISSALKMKATKVSGKHYSEGSEWTGFSRLHQRVPSPTVSLKGTRSVSPTRKSQVAVSPPPPPPIFRHSPFLQKYIREGAVPRTRPMDTPPIKPISTPTPPPYDEPRKERRRTEEQGDGKNMKRESPSPLDTDCPLLYREASRVRQLHSSHPALPPPDPLPPKVHAETQSQTETALEPPGRKSCDASLQTEAENVPAGKCAAREDAQSQCPPSLVIPLLSEAFCEDNTGSDGPEVVLEGTSSAAQGNANVSGDALRELDLLRKVLTRRLQEESEAEKAAVRREAEERLLAELAARREEESERALLHDRLSRRLEEAERSRLASEGCERDAVGKLNEASRRCTELQKRLGESESMLEGEKKERSEDQSTAKKKEGQLQDSLVDLQSQLDQLKQAWQMDRGALLAELEAAKIEQVASRRREVAAEGRSREEAARRCEAENAIQAQTEELGRLRLESLETEKRCAADREVSHGAMKQLYSQIDGQRYEIARLQARVEHLAQCADLIRADALENSSSPLRFEDLRDAQPQILSRASPPCLVSAKALVTGDSVRASSPLALQMRGGAGAATQTGGRNEFDCSQPPMQEGGGSAERERKQKTAEATLWGYAEVFGVEGALRRLAACSSPVMKSEVALPAPQDVEGAAKREGREGPLDSAREFSVERTSGLTKTHDSIAESLIHSILQ